jgi:hypothetical protein
MSESASYSTLTSTRFQCVAQQSLNLYRMQRATRMLRLRRNSANYLTIAKTTPSVSLSSHGLRSPTAEGLLLHQSYPMITSRHRLLHPMHTLWRHLDCLSLNDNPKYAHCPIYDPIRFSVLAWPSFTNSGRSTPTPKLSNDYVSASSTSSYAHSMASSRLPITQ